MRTLHALIARALIALTIFLTVYGAHAHTCTAPAPVTPAPLAFSGGEPSERLQILYHTVWQYIRDSYYDPSRIKHWDSLEHAYDDKLSTFDDLHIALKDLAQKAGDKWTYYASPADITARAQLANNHVYTTGLELEKNGGDDYTIDVIHHLSPAFNTALRERDRVRCINGVAIKTLPKENVDALLRGKAGDRVVVTAASAKDGSEFEVTLTIAETPRPSVEARLLPDTKIVYLRFPAFDGESTITEFLAAFAAAYKEAGSIDGIVLDVRNNLGGNMPDAVKFVSLFLADENAVVVKSIVRNNAVIKETDLKVVPLRSLTISGKHVDEKLVEVLKTARMAVLSNGSSASAAEVTIGGLKDNKRATIFGVRSFGKGVGFKTTNGPIGGIVSVTGMKYLTPNGHDVHGRGIEPDVVVEQPRDSTDDAQLAAAKDWLSKP